MTTINTTPSSYDFDDLMSSLVVFMQAQEEFKDYNFTGAGLRELMRLLSYNSQHNALQNQFAFSELNLDSAQLRQNVVSIVSNLGYFTRGKTAARVTGDIVVVPKDNPAAGTSLTMKKDARFFANRDGGAVFFSPSKEYSTVLADGVFTFKDVVLVQGTWMFQSFISTSNEAVEAFVIPDANVDVQTMQVQVRQTETSSAYDVFNKFRTAYDLGPAAKTYFVKENRDGLFELEFGDGKISTRVKFGNVIIVEYLSTGGDTGNDVSALTPANGIGSYFDIRVDLKGSKSYGGADVEDIASIKKTAPLAVAAQGNAVNSRDYIAVVNEIFPDAQSVASWGGEENRPPHYGYTFVSVALANGQTLDAYQKAALKKDLERYNVGSIDVIMVDPEYIYLVAETVIRYNPRATALAEVPFKAKVTDYIRRFSAEKLESFGSYFDKSRLYQFINQIDRSIQGNRTSIRYEKRFTPAINFSGTYSFDFSRSLTPGSLLIDNFIVSDSNSLNFSYFIADAAGVLKLSKRDLETDNVVPLADVGVVDYESGKIDLVNFNPISILNGYVRLRVAPLGDESLRVYGRDLPIIQDVSINLEPTYE